MEQLLTLMLQWDLNIPSMPITQTLSFLLRTNLVRISIIMEGLLTLRLRIVKQTNKCKRRNSINLTRAWVKLLEWTRRFKIVELWEDLSLSLATLVRLFSLKPRQLFQEVKRWTRVASWMERWRTQRIKIGLYLKWASLKTFHLQWRLMLVKTTLLGTKDDELNSLFYTFNLFS